MEQSNESYFIEELNFDEMLKVKGGKMECGSKIVIIYVDGKIYIIKEDDITSL